ncbi:hypothetical protein F5X99DRAFT_395106 [Biscogniauxia marginata]|nr:hypothetical protein F5X99DRAFT_395106 [Biscogniauxia marginata]
MAPGLMDRLCDAYNSSKMTFEQLTGNAKLIIRAGSETTAKLLSGQISRDPPISIIEANQRERRVLLYYF